MLTANLYVDTLWIPGVLTDLCDHTPQPSAVKASDTGSEGQPEVVNAEGQQYTESKAYVMLEINLQRPLVPKRPPEELAKRYQPSVVH